MGFDLGALALGDLFFGGAADVGAAAATDAGIGAAAADLGLGAATDVGAGLATDVGATVGADLGAGGLGALAGGATDVGTALGTEGLGATLSDAAAAGGAADVTGALEAATPEAVAAAPELQGAITSLGDLGTSVGAGDFADTQGIANAFTAEQSLGLPSGGLPGAVVGPGTEDVGAFGAVAGPTQSSAQAGADITSALGADPNAAEATLPAGAGSTLAAPGTATGGAAAAAPAASAGGGLSSTVGNVLNSPITKAAELALPLGFLGYNLLKGPAPLPSAATQAVGNVQGATANVPLLNQTTAEDLSLANNYQVTPGMAASLDTYKQNAYNQLYQQLANEGITNPTQSSQWVQGKMQIDQQTETLKGQMVQQLVAQAISAQGAATTATSSADNTLLQVAQLQVQQDKAFSDSISAALQSFGMLAAFQSLTNKGAGGSGAQATA